MYLQRGGIPCLVKKIEGGVISGHILTNLLKHLDALKMYDNDQENVIIPVLLVDGYGSHFDMDFWKYICDENHKWTVVFGVPCVTSL